MARHQLLLLCYELIYHCLYLLLFLNFCLTVFVDCTHSISKKFFNCPEKKILG